MRSRGIDLPPGDPADPPGAWTAAGLGKAKSALFLEELSRDGVQIFPGTLDLITRLRESQVPIALVSSLLAPGGTVAMRVPKPTPRHREA